MEDDYIDIEQLQDLSPLYAGLTLAGLITSQLVLLITLIHVIYPKEECEHTPSMIRMPREVKGSGATVFPRTIMSLKNLKHVLYSEPAPTRGFELKEQDQTLLMLEKEGTRAFIKNMDDLYKDNCLRFGTLLAKKLDISAGPIDHVSCEHTMTLAGVTLAGGTPTGGKWQAATFNTPFIPGSATLTETEEYVKMLLKRQKGKKEKNKKKKKALDVLDAMAKTITAEDNQAAPRRGSSKTPTPNDRTPMKDDSAKVMTKKLFVMTEDAQQKNVSVSYMQTVAKEM